MNSKVFLIGLVILCCTFFAKGQVGVSYQYSNIHPNIAVSYGSTNDWWGEMRISMDVSADNLSAEIIGAHNFIKKESADLYGAIGIKANLFTGPMAMIGLNLYPLESKNFALIIEPGFIYDTDGDQGIFRGIVGLRYVFDKSEN